MVAPINRVLFPSYVHLANDPDRLRAGFRSTLGLITLLILPICVGIAVLSEPLVRVMLGEKWLETVPLISLLAIAGAAIVLQATTGSVYNALGLPRMIALTGAIHAVTLIPLLPVATAALGLQGVAWAVVLHSVAIGLPVTYVLFLRRTPIRLADLLQVCWRPIVASTLMFLILRSLLAFVGPLGGFADSVVALLSGSVAGAVVYGASILLLWALARRPEGAEVTAVLRIGRALQRSTP
jgi:O-antigen/teichoic acid export membrane protein